MRSPTGPSKEERVFGGEHSCLENAGSLAEPDGDEQCLRTILFWPSVHDTAITRRWVGYSNRLTDPKAEIRWPCGEDIGSW
jgi:hypothetical protein